MLKYTMAFFIVIGLTPFVFTCKDIPSHADRYLTINVHYTPAGQDVDAGHQLWAVILSAALWDRTYEIARFSSSTRQIIIPMYNQYTGYLVIGHDADGDGLLNNGTTGDPCIGFDDITPSNPLTSFVFFRIPTQILDVNLSSAKAGTCPFP